MTLSRYYCRMRPPVQLVDHVIQKHGGIAGAFHSNGES